MTGCKLVWVALLAGICGLPAWGQSAPPAPPDSMPARGLVPGGAFSISEMETVNSVNGNLMYRLPLASFTPTPGGLAGGVSLSYNSALYDLTSTYVSPPSSPDQKVVQSTLAVSAYGGWQLGYQYALDLQLRPTLESGFVCGTGAAEVALRPYQLWAIFPDGSRHVLHPNRSASTGLYADGYYRFDPAGTASTACGSPAGPGNTDLTYFTADGTYVRVVVAGSPDARWWEHTWTMSFPDGTSVTGKGSSTTEMKDRIGNRITVEHVDAPGNDPQEILTDQAGRTITITHTTTATGSVKDTVTQTGSNGSLLTWTVNRGAVPLLAAPAQAYACGTGLTCTLDIALLSGVTSVQMPAAGGFTPTYTFGYAGAAVRGWGELSDVTFPSGAKVHYAYQFDGLNRGFYPLENAVAAKTVTWCDESDGNPVFSCSGSAVQELTTWSTPGAYERHMTGPDGGVTKTTFVNPYDIQNWQRGLVTKVENPNSSSVTRTWQQNKPVVAGGVDPGNPYVSSEVRETETLAGQSLSATTYFTLDKNGNQTSRTDSDWGGVWLRTTAQVMKNPVATASATAQESEPNAYWNPNGPGLRALVACQAVTGPGGSANVSERRHPLQSDRTHGLHLSAAFAAGSRIS